MSRKLLILLFVCFLHLSILGQNEGTINAVGVNFSIASDVLKEGREIQVFLPDDYSKSDKKYPVVYILDGQRLFLHGVSLERSFVQFKQTPEFIVVGILSKERGRSKDFITGSKAFLDFIEKEVIGFIDQKFRTSDERLLFGWAFGGGFVVDAMNSKPDLFASYIAASPFPVENKLENVETLLSKNPKFARSLYFTSGTDEGVVKEGTEKLNKLLMDKAPKTLNWTFRELEGEEHRSTPFTTLYHGIQSYYSYYPELQFNNLDEFKKMGGLSYVYDYYKKRAKQFGFSPNLTAWTMFSLTRTAIRANDYAQFDFFVNEFKGNAFIGLLRVSRACSIAEFYLKNKQYKKAESMFLFLTKKHPNAERPLNGLGDVYKALKDEKRALEYYQKARELSER